MAINKRGSQLYKALLLLFGSFLILPCWAKTCSKLGTNFQSTSDTVKSIVDSQSDVCVLAEGFAWTEGPLWVEELDGLLFSDIPASKVYLYDSNDKLTTYLSDSKFSNGLVREPTGSLVLMQSRNRTVGKMSVPVTAPQSSFEVLASAFKGAQLNSPNDGVFTRDGDLFFTDPPYGLPGGIHDESKALPFQGVFLLNRHGELKLLDSTLSYPNGIALSADETTLFVAVSDANDSAWYRYDVNPDLSLSGRSKVFVADKNVQGHGLPDGMAFHKDGLLFATGPQGIYIFDNDGMLLGRILIDNIVSNVAFDSTYRTLYITANNTLMSVSLK